MKSANHKLLISNALKYAVIIILSFTFGVIINDLPYFELENKISPLAISNTLLTSFLAIYLPFFHNRFISNERAEKDIYLGICEKIMNDINDLINEIDNLVLSRKKINKLQSGIILAKTKKIRHDIFLLTSANNNLSKIIPTTKIKKTIHNFWSVLTADLGGSKPKISNFNYHRTQTEYTKLYSQMIEIQKLINRA